jgi:hypothetical protein
MNDDTARRGGRGPVIDPQVAGVLRLLLGIAALTVLLAIAK